MTIQESVIEYIQLVNNGYVAQLDRVSVFETECCEFKSHRTHQILHCLISISSLLCKFGKLENPVQVWDKAPIFNACLVIVVALLFRKENALVRFQ